MNSARGSERLFSNRPDYANEKFNRSSTPNRYETSDYRGDTDRSSTPYQNSRSRRGRGQMSNIKYQVTLGEDAERLKDNVENHLLQRMDEQQDDTFDEDEIDSLALNWLWHVAL